MTLRDLTHSRGALARFRAREPVFGMFQSIPSPTLTELAIWSGFDFIALDCQHGVVDEAAHLASLQVISGSSAFSVVRVRPQDYGAVSRYLDFGADVIVLPEVQSQAECASLVAAATRGGAGTRSSTGSGARSSRYGLLSEKEQQRPILLAIIEKRSAVADIDRIAATPGLDGFVIGPHDLSADLGCSGDFANPEYKKAFAAIEKAATEAGILLGSGVHPGFDIQRLLSAGHCFIQVSSDTVALRSGFNTHLAAVRGAIQGVGR